MVVRIFAAAARPVLAGKGECHITIAAEIHPDPAALFGIEDHFSGRIRDVGVEPHRGFQVIVNAGLETSGVRVIECSGQCVIMRHAIAHLGFDELRQQVGCVHHHLLGGLIGLRFHILEEIARKLIETQRHDERDEEQRDACEAHDGCKSRNQGAGVRQ